MKTLMDARRRRRNRVILLALAALAMLPLAAALVLYYLAPGMAGGAQTNHGALLDPPGALADLELTMPDGRRIEAGPERRWRLILVNPRGCNEACRQDLHLLRQMHVRLGRDRDRVRRVLAVGTASEGTLEALRRDYRDLAVAKAPADLLARLRERRTLVGGDREARVGARARGVLVVDPLGNVILLHAAEQIGEPLFEDVKRLLRLSNIG